MKKEIIRLEVPSESSARQRIHMKNQASFSLKDKSKKFKCCLLQFLLCALRVKMDFLKVSIVLLVIKRLNTNHYEKTVQSSSMVFKCGLLCRHQVLDLEKSRGNKFWK